MKEILNFGAGVNSTALIIEMVNRGIKPDYVIFADTGCEMPETYEHLKVMEEWFKSKDLKFVIVHSKHNSLYDFCYSKKTIPMRKFRWCTDKFKKVPITDFLKQFKKEGVVQHIGIGYDETYRIRQSEVKWITFRYLLAEWKLTRNDCIKIIEKEGLKIPVKSGCFMCPFQPKEAWERLYKNNKEMWVKSRKLEENASKYPNFFLHYNYPLKTLELSWKEQKTLFELHTSDVCDGWCYT